MKFIKKLSYVLLLAIFFATGCKQESLTDNPKSDQPTGVSKNAANPLNPEMGKGGGVVSYFYHYQANAAEVLAAKNDWLNGIQSKGIQARGACGMHISDMTYLMSIDAVNQPVCSNALWDITIRVHLYDYVGSGYSDIPQTAIFTDNLGNPLTATLIGNTTTLTDPSCDAWNYDGYCTMLRELDYRITNINAPQVFWPITFGSFNIEILSGFSANCSPLLISGSIPAHISNYALENSPARIYYTPSNNFGNIFIGTECSISCHPSYVQCPTGGTFTYWPDLNPTSTTTLSVPTSGLYINPLPVGNYSFTCVLTYPGGITSLPLTGSFQIN